MNGRQIRKIRAGLGITQHEFAQRLDVTTTTVSLWETGRHLPAAAQQEGLAALEAEGGSAPDHPALRPIQYLGSKLKVAHQICDLLGAVTSRDDTVGDLFSGSGAVSSVLSRERQTIAIDMQGYSSALAEAIFCNQAEAVDELRNPDFLIAFERAEGRLLHQFRELVVLDDHALEAAENGSGHQLDQLISFGSVAAHQQLSKSNTPKDINRALSAVAERIYKVGAPHRNGIASLYYGGVYFSMRQAIALDAISSALDKVSPAARVLGAGVLLSVASELANTVGKQFAQPMRIIKASGSTQSLLLARATRDRRLTVLDAWTKWLERWELELQQPRCSGRAVRQDVLSFVEADTECAAFYADPPYTIDHYSRFYHVLETLTLRDLPLLDTQKQRGSEVIMRGLYRAGRHQSQFSVPSSVKGAFQRLFIGAARGGRSLVLSYSPFDEKTGQRPRLLSLKEITDLARIEFSKVEVIDVKNHSHRKLNAKETNMHGPSTGETLILCES
nr:DNA adenine methylase [Amylibacter sp.]